MLRSGITSLKDVYLHYWVIWTIFEQYAFIRSILGFFRALMIRLSEFGIGKVEAVYQFLLDITIML